MLWRSIGVIFQNSIGAYTDTVDMARDATMVGQPRSPSDVVFLRENSGFLDIVVGMLYVLAGWLRVVIAINHGGWGDSGSKLLDHMFQVLTESL